MKFDKQHYIYLNTYIIFVKGLLNAGGNVTMDYLQNYVIELYI
jgi:hypothetical protein